MVILYLSVSKSDHLMKKAFVLIAIAALMVCFVPMVDSSDAADTTTISGYLYEGSKDISLASSIYISIIYSDDETNGETIGHTDTISPWSDSSKTNKFSVTIQPKVDTDITHYYIYFNIYGFSINSLPSAAFEKKTIECEGGVKYTCYKLAGSDITPNADNPIGDSSSAWFIMKIAEGIVSGKVSTKTDEPVYLNGVTVTLYDLEKKNELKSTTTGNGGEYSLSYSTGSYVIKFELGGYQSEEMEVVITEETPAIKNATLKETQSFFGVDLPHALMIIGGSLAVILLVFTLFMRLRLSKR